MNSTTEPPTRGLGPPPRGWLTACLRGATNQIFRSYAAMTSPGSQTVITRPELVALLTEHGVTVDERLTDDQLVALLDSSMAAWKAKAATA